MSFLLAAITAATAYLQADAKWWKGLAVAGALFVLVPASTYVVPAESLKGPLDPASGILIALMLGAAFVALGAVISLILRAANLTSGRIAGAAFAVGLLCVFVLQVFL
ncbi:hypothetical protein [Aliiroseovarius crassostreae]|uniref:hypothetical protein n=1 Tax=Aliiroseovarius crassostreae TaxID=154981 RepID=UPI0022082655|nr:hypothetical protein [Aliiroseovarius crassostreae]UWQ08491.1 hypothetical protein K3X25_02540 [Aliiroseovarius crassostreae]